jgi:GAF domain-containing protein
LARNPDLDASCPRWLTELGDIATSTGCAVFEIDPLHEAVQVEACVGQWLHRDLEALFRDPAPRHIVCAPRVTALFALDRRRSVPRRARRVGGEASAVCLPIPCRDPQNRFLLFAYRRSHRFSPHDLNTLELLATILGLVVDRDARRNALNKATERIARLESDIERLCTLLHIKEDGSASPL